MNIRELLEKRAGLVRQAKEILEGAEAENRALTQEEQNHWDTLMTEVANIRATVDRAERQRAAEDELGESRGMTEPPAANEEQGSGYEFQARSLRALNGAEQRSRAEWQGRMAFAAESYLRAYRAWMVNGPQGLGSEELRALAADSDVSGGFLVTPLQLVDRLIQAMDNAVYVRQYATVFAVPNAGSLGVPSLDSDPADPTWTSELAIGTEDSSMTFGRRELTPHPLAEYIKVSRKLLRMVPSTEGLVMDRLAYKFAVVAENAYLNGSGVGEPLGIFTAHDNGISTSRDVSTDNTTTAITADNLRACKYALKKQYRSRARWMFHRDGVAAVSKLKDGNGQYLWQPGIAAGDPDRLLNMPIDESEYAPNTFTTGLYVGALGDWSYYWIADAMAVEMQRLVELYAGNNQIGFIGRLESDGMPVLEEAFVRVTLA